MSGTRKIAAILVADIVGYSRLAGTDEDRTLSRLRALRSDLIDPAIDTHHGRIVKRTGDGSLIEFRSVVDAVGCAIEVQNGMIERNSGLPPERRIEFRIGVHLGDVVEESDGDLMGDGVNIAARLEGIAAPGSICLSEDACRRVTAARHAGHRSRSDPSREHRTAVPAYSLQVGVPAQAKPTEAKPPEPKAFGPTPLATALAALGHDRGTHGGSSMRTSPRASPRRRPPRPPGFRSSCSVRQSLGRSGTGLLVDALTDD